MTRDDIVQIIRDLLLFNNGIDETILLRHMDRIQERYERGFKGLPRPWFNLDTTATVTTVAATRTVDLPSDFIGFDENWKLSIESTDTSGNIVTSPLPRKSQFELLADTDAISAMPTAFELGASTIWLYPIPDIAYTINFPYWKSSSALSTVDTSSWFTELSDLLIEEVLYEIGRSSGQFEALKLSRLSEVQASYHVRAEERLVMLKSLHMGSTRRNTT